MMKAQVSLELLITVGVVFAFTIPVLLLLLSVSQFGYEKSTLAQADAASKTIADNINELFVQGPGSKKTITIAFPTNMQNLSIKDKEVVIRLKTSSGVYEAASPIFANATIINPSSLNKRAGLFSITLRTKSKPNGDVEVEVYG